MTPEAATAASDWQAEPEYPLTTAPAFAQPPEKNDTPVGQEERVPPTNATTTTDTHGLFAHSPTTALAAKGATPGPSSAEGNRLLRDTVTPAVYVSEEKSASDGTPRNVVPKLEGDGDVRTTGPGETGQPFLFDTALVPEHSEPSANEIVIADRGEFIANVVAANGGANRVVLNAMDAAPNRDEAVAQDGILRGEVGIEQGSGVSLGQLDHAPALTIRGAELNATAPIFATAQGGKKEALTDTSDETGATTVITDRPLRAEKMSDTPQVEHATPGAAAVSAIASASTMAGEAAAEGVTRGILAEPGHLVSTSDDGEQLRLDEEVGYSAPSSPEQRVAGRGSDYDEAERNLSGDGGEDETVTRKDGGGKRDRKHRHRRKHNRHRDREGGEQKYRQGGSRRRDGNRGGAGGSRRDEGENATSTDSRRSSPRSPAVATLAPLKRAPPPPHLFIGATDGDVEAPVSPTALSAVNSDSAQGSGWGDGNVSSAGGSGLP